jgi:hypothetical protein
MEKITLTKNEPIDQIIFGDNPYILITSIEVHASDTSNEVELVKGLEIDYILSNRKGSTRSNSFDLEIETKNKKRPISNKSPLIYNNTRIEFNDDEFEKIKFTLNYKNEGYNDIEVILFYDRIDLISIEDPKEDFRTHIDKPSNSKILFSAPFGQGKTTFLKEFFIQHEKEYEVFHLYPVNYSVAQNEDIFQYIKVELLLQLFGKDVEFNKVDFSKTLTAFEFAKNHFDEIMLPFARLIPKVGDSIHGFVKDFINLKKSFDGYHKDINIDDKSEAENFIKSYYEKEGSLFEDNFFTQLIRQLVEQLKETKKQTILIVDDIDRMDPEHIFRILNVFAAHFDSEYKDEEGSNKFGFDKVILVCDYSNLRHIFRHKYGEKTDYEGYIDKFFSRSIYEFNNNEAVRFIISNLNKHIDSDFFFTVVNDLLKTNNISLRALYKLEKLISKNYIYQRKLQTYRHYEQIVSLFALTQIMSSDSLISKLERCKNDLDIQEDANYKELTANCFICLYDKSTSPYRYHYREKNYTFTHVNRSNSHGYYEIGIISNSLALDSNIININKLPFNHHDFYDLVIQIIKKNRILFEN